jgi:phosphoribosyl-ATP pyrophosphohydrolase
MFKDLEHLVKLIRERKDASPSESYTSKLMNDKNLSVSKVKEEIGELIEAIEKNTNKVHESADVLYHLLVYLESNNVKIEDVVIQNSKIAIAVKDGSNSYIKNFKSLNNDYDIVLFNKKKEYNNPTLKIKNFEKNNKKILQSKKSILVIDENNILGKQTNSYIKSLLY